MPKFITLTEKRADGVEQMLLLNTNNINSVKLAKGGDTHVNMNDSHYFFVKQSVEEIRDAIWMMERGGSD